MLGCHKIRNEAESQRVDLDGLLVDNARTIENLLRRAHEIHRQHGGILGYDLEDWLQAEKELAEEHRKFLLALTLDSRGFPRYQGDYAGVDGCFELLPA